MDIKNPCINAALFSYEHSELEIQGVPVVVQGLKQGLNFGGYQKSAHNARSARNSDNKKSAIHFLTDGFINFC